jgi:hypothetical protein
LLELPETQAVIEPFDPFALVYPWNHPDPRMDELHQSVLAIIQEDQQRDAPRRETWERIWHTATRLTGTSASRPRLREGFGYPAVPQLSEPWYC